MSHVAVLERDILDDKVAGQPIDQVKKKVEHSVSSTVVEPAALRFPIIPHAIPKKR